MFTEDQRTMASQICSFLESAEDELIALQTSIDDNDEQPPEYSEAIELFCVKVTALKAIAQQIHSDELEDIQKIKFAKPPKEKK